MIRKLLLLLATAAFVSTYLLGQSGIGTPGPDEDLHVGGNTSNVRVDGLNSANDPRNLGGSDFYNLAVDADGTSYLLPQSGEIVTTNPLATPVRVQSLANSALNTGDLYQQNFTLEHRALVVITYTIAVDFKSYDNLSNINDGRVKVAQNFFYLGDGTTEDSSTAYGLSSCSYSNYFCDTATGFVYNTSSVLVTLEAGTHSIHMKGAVFGGGTNADAAFSATFGTQDRIDISTIYL